MSFPALKEAQEKRAALSADLKSIFDEAGTDAEGNVTLDKVTSISGGKDAVLAKIRETNAELEEVANEIKDLKELERGSRNADLNESGDGAEPEPVEQPKSLGEMFVDSQAYKARSGSNGPTATLDMHIYNTDFTTSAGWAPESLRIGRVELDPQRPAPNVVNFIPKLPTSQAAVKYMEETTFTNNAAEAAEGAAYGEAALALTERSQTVEKVAVFLPVTDEQLEDVDQAQAYVNSRLRFMLDQRIDSQVLVGNGTTPNLLGTENVTGINTQALGTDPIPDAIYKAFTSIRDTGFAEPSVVFIRPSKWQTVRLLRTSDGQYIWGHPSQAGPESIWGVPVVQTTAVTSTKAITGDYTNFAALYLRRGVDVQVSNSHSTFFTSGKQAIRADVRLAMVHYRPEAFSEVTGL